MFSPPDSPRQTSKSLSHLIHTTFSYDGNAMLAAIISLLLVTLFVLLLHIYAKWFLAQARHRRRSSMSVSHVLGPSLFHNVHTFAFDNTLSTSPTKGLDASVIAVIPLFVYKSNEHNHGLECVICLSMFEDEEVGRNLPKCHHAFHVECIDMWLHSHSSCPICRAPVVCEKITVIDNPLQNDVASLERGGELSEVMSSELDNIIDGNSSLEIMIETSSGSENMVVNDLISACSSSSSLSSQSSSLSSSLKRMLSRNRSEHKVYPSSIANESLTLN